LGSKYRAIIERCRQAIDILMPTQQHAGALRQHGPGKKHSRPIQPEPWQQTLVDQATEGFILGLIRSDGATRRVRRTDGPRGTVE
jgi:hypothetical protein